MIAITDNLKSETGTLTGYYCFLDIHRVNNLWLAFNTGVSEEDSQEVLKDEDFDQGISRVTECCIRAFSRLLHNALHKYDCSWETWSRQLMYPQRVRTSLAELWKSEAQIYNFFTTLFSSEGSSLFHCYGTRQNRSILRWTKNCALFKSYFLHRCRP